MPLSSPFRRMLVAALSVCALFLVNPGVGSALGKGGVIRAGAAKVDITNRDVPLVNDPLHARALVLEQGETKVVLIALDVVSLGEIGYVRNDYLGKVRTQLQQEFNIDPRNVLINASHCHGIPCTDIDQRTVQAVREAVGRLVPVRVGAGRGEERRIMENRRLKLKSGKEADVRHAYSLPPDEEVVGVGPVDTEIGLLKLERDDGTTLAAVYNFACHPIQGVPSGGNTADVTGFSSKVIEDNLGEGAVALFFQGCGGDINPVFYKDVDHPRDAEPLGNMLGLSTLSGLRSIRCQPGGTLKVINETLALPRRFDGAERLESMQAEQTRLLESLGGTSLNLKTFLPLAVKYKLSSDFPSYYSHRYLHDKQIGRNELSLLDAENRRNMEAYLRNIHTMEHLSRLRVNMALVRKHKAANEAAGQRTVDVEVVGLRIGEFVLVTFPGELTVQIGLNIKKGAPQKTTFVAGYTNGYIYYAPTAEQILAGEAQEDCDSILAPEWQALYEARMAELLKKL
ncbi:MAG: hypothetical protein ACKV0T_01685 [Planctomycetales bacterium]